MKEALVAGYPHDSRRSETPDLDTSEFYLPHIQCDVCKETWCDTEVWYPTLSVAKGADVSKFDEDAVVTVEEFKQLKKQLVGLGDRRLRLLPGAGIGPVRARLPQRPTDFVWCGMKLLASRRAVEALKEHGVWVPYGPAVVRIGKQEHKDLYVALELDPVPLYSEVTLEETTLTFCNNCGSCELQNVSVKLEKVQIQYLRSRMPKGQGLVRVYESYATLATEEFVDAVRTEGLTGITFRKEGIFV